MTEDAVCGWNYPTAFIGIRVYCDGQEIKGCQPLRQLLLSAVNSCNRQLGRGISSLEFQLSAPVRDDLGKNKLK